MISTLSARPEYPKRNSVLWITTCGLFMALTIILSSFGVPVPGGKLYLCDTAITTAAILLDPIGAMLVGGLGSFIGDALFYPAPMWVSLVVHGLQAYVISWLAHNTFKNKPIYGAILGVSVGCVILVAGYTLGKIYVYSTFEYAMLKLPYEIAQGVIGAVSGVVLTYGLGLKKVWQTMINRQR
ncbi:ECF transporter S component [Erysipelotrichaceae bacterium RD49]|nr:ECF transporter S component [Erysipelotrichaceae bacterium RD49]